VHDRQRTTARFPAGCCHFSNQKDHGGAEESRWLPDRPNPFPVLAQICRASVLERYIRLKQFMGIQFPALVDIKPVELRCHELHPLFLGDSAVFVRVHQKQQLFGFRRWQS
jgi:hypothetical protein